MKEMKIYASASLLAVAVMAIVGLNNAFSKSTILGKAGASETNYSLVFDSTHNLATAEDFSALAMSVASAAGNEIEFGLYPGTEAKTMGNNGTWLTSTNETGGSNSFTIENFDLGDALTVNRITSITTEFTGCDSVTLYWEHTAPNNEDDFSNSTSITSLSPIEFPTDLAENVNYFEIFYLGPSELGQSFSIQNITINYVC